MDAFNFLRRLLEGSFIRRLLALVLLVTLQPAQAQEALAYFVPVTGTLSSGAVDSWTFSAADGAFLSVTLRATNGDLDPMLTISDPGGNRIFSNDDYTPDTRDARLEGFTVPGTDIYTLEVSGFGTTAGDYELTILPGFADLSVLETFTDEANWSSDNDTVEIVFGNNRMALLLAGVQEQAVATYAAEDVARDQYVQVDIPEVSGANGWQVGLIVRQQAADTYYLYSLNYRGEWRFSVNAPEGQTVLRDWSMHPAIVAGQTTFSLGLLANETSFEFFYNGQLIGRLTDATIPEAGAAAVHVATPAQPGSEVVAQFQNLAITIPAPEPLTPQQISTGNSTVMIPELQRRRLIPPSGTMGLIVPESFITYNRPGVNDLPLGGDQTFENFALGTTVTWEIAERDLPVGCGLLLGRADATHYWLAYLDQTGAYGLSQRVDDRFEPGIFGAGLNLETGLFRLLVIASGEQLLYYVNGQLVGTLETPPAAGGVGNAVINFEPTTTSCQFTDTWVWTWD